ncbi:MAG: DNA repair protein RadC [Candidatus Aenigmarchaeota archaeon]|nr:DNA repair protein RadC [Candidatus Aenigmarchaeota archaeon]
MKVKYKVRIRDLPKFERPREKLMSTNEKLLTDAELIAIILGSGTKGENAIKLADKLLRSKDLLSLDFRALREIKGIGNAKACKLLASIELGRRLFSCKKERIIKSPEDAYEYAKEIEKCKKEYLIALYLDTRNAVIKKDVISIGTLNTNAVHPREVFYPAISEFASGVILIHNHPSGGHEPSEDDIKMTKRMAKAGKLMGIEIIDHIIIGNGKYTSLKEAGFI